MSAEPPRRLVYVDASALVKLILPEPESEALSQELVSEDELLSSIVGAVETRRAVLVAAGDREVADRAEEVLASVTLVGVTEEIARTAGSLQPPLLRSLDAIHLATALILGDELHSLVAYDERLALAAREAGILTRAPGRG